MARMMWTRTTTIRFIVGAVAIAGSACGEAYIEATYSPQTKYAAGFDEASFAAVAVGMTKAEVLQRLGPPIREFTHANITFVVYSDIGHYTKESEKAYRQRWLAVNEAESVVYVFRRTITTDHDPTYPVGGWVLDERGVYQPVVRAPYAAGPVASR